MTTTPLPETPTKQDIQLEKTLGIAQLAVKRLDHDDLVNTIANLYHQAYLSLTHQAHEVSDLNQDRNFTEEYGELLDDAASTYTRSHKKLDSDEYTKQAREIAETFVELLKNASSMEDLHTQYREIIHEPYKLAEPMAACREHRAENIGTKVAGLMADSEHPELPILDYGCGGGRPAAEVQKNTNRTIIAADVGNFLVDGIPDTVIFEPISEGKGLSQVQNASIGDAFLSYVLHHTDGAAYQEQFNELYRVLADGGKLHVLETGISDDAGQQNFDKKHLFLKAQLIDFITSNFFREETIPMPVLGLYFDEDTWTTYAEKAGFEKIRSLHTGKDNFGEDCFEMTFVKRTATKAPETLSR